MKEYLGVFRSRFLRFFAVMFVGGTGLGAAFILVRHGFNVDPEAALAGFLFGAALSLLLTLAAVLYFKVYVAGWGISCYDFWGFYRDVEWGDIVSTRPFNLLGLRYLRVYYAGSSSPVWLPLFLHGQEQFWALVRQHAGPDNPLVRAAGAPEQPVSG